MRQNIKSLADEMQPRQMKFAWSVNTTKNMLLTIMFAIFVIVYLIGIISKVSFLLLFIAIIFTAVIVVLSIFAVVGDSLDQSKTEIEPVVDNNSMNETIDEIIDSEDTEINNKPED